MNCQFCEKQFTPSSWAIKESMAGKVYPGGGVSMTAAEKIQWLKDNHKSALAVRAAFHNLRILKRRNPGDTYYENYLWHYDKRGDDFVDTYTIAWLIGSNFPLTSVMEIGCRTGISLCQLLSPKMMNEMPYVALFDIFNDGFISAKIVEMNLQHLAIPLSPDFHVGDSAKTVPDFKGKNPGKVFSWILVDGNHEKVAARVDLENVVDMVEPGGFLVMDDLAPDGCALDDVWQAFKVDHPEFLFWESYEGKGVGVAICV
jgi:predicted O-methyltransferase YrrM